MHRTILAAPARLPLCVGMHYGQYWHAGNWIASRALVDMGAVDAEMGGCAAAREVFEVSYGRTEKKMMW
jgi:hypothetical protein